MYDTNNEELGKGYLVIKVSTARGAIPLEAASVNVRGGDKESSGIIYATTTNSSGLTKKLELPAPPRVLSESPSSVLPYALYDIDVFKEGYIPLKLKNVAVFDSVTSIQSAVMIPLSDNKYTDSYDKSTTQSPDDQNTQGGA